MEKLVWLFLLIPSFVFSREIDYSPAINTVKDQLIAKSGIMPMIENYAKRELELKKINKPVENILATWQVIRTKTIHFKYKDTNYTVKPDTLVIGYDGVVYTLQPRFVSVSWSW